ncbi:MAG: threonine synthase [Nitrosomonadales bacterium]|nr:MAG: threonine synthase [Nitrosomonadales bacterium]
MKYLSTRGGMPPKTFTEILLGGLATDGGLTIPDAYPRLSRDELAAMRGMSYRDLAFEVIRRFADDIPAADLRAIVDKTYTAETFRSDDITPVKTLEPGLHILGLSNGPTLAFKDVAMQLLGNLFEYVLEQENAEINILGATSGDTGSAAEYAMRGKQRVKVFMLSPLGKMSPFQTAQMFSLQDPNIFNIAVKGVFDDCQDIVKAVSSDLEFKSKHKIGAVNSINWARVTAQVVYYFKAYFAVTRSNDEEVSFSVPSGNFGNVCAGHIARQMGLPIHKLIVATNENDVLDEFFRTGVYRPRPETRHTSSPSMDISKASNFERFVYDLVGRDPAVVKELWQKIDGGGSFDLSATPYFARVKDFGFTSGESSHANRLETIRHIYQKYGVMIDTHTADGVKVGLEHREAGIPLVCLETALPAKFEETIREALGREPERPAELADLEKRPQRYEVMDSSADAVKRFIVAHSA